MIIGLCLFLPLDFKLCKVSDHGVHNCVLIALPSICHIVGSQGMCWMNEYDFNTMVLRGCVFDSDIPGFKS